MASLLYPFDARNTLTASATVATIADAEALPWGQYASVFVAGQTAAGDGGGGQYYWESTSTAAADGVSVIALTAQSAIGRFVRTVSGNATLGGDVAGATANNVVGKIDGVNVPSSAPSAGQYIRASSSTALQYSSIQSADVPVAVRIADVHLDYGADSTGIGNAVTPILSALSANSDVRYSSGTYLIPATASIGSSGKTHHFMRGAVLKVAAGQALTLDGAIDAAHDQQIADLSASGSSLVLTSASASRFHAEWVGIKGDDSTDNTVALQKLIDAFPATGGVIVFGPGRYRFSDTIDISSHTNLTFEGEGSRFMQDFDNSPTALIYTGTADPAIHVHTNYARNFQCKEIEITYTSASFTGDLIRVGGDGLEGCPGVSFHHCEMGGTSSAYGAASVVSVSSSEQVILDECLVMFAQRGVYSPASTGINSGLILDKCQCSNFTRAQVEILSGTMLGPKLHRCLFDNTTLINPPYGILIGATDFSICDNVFAGGTADKTPSGYCADLTGTGRFVGNMLLTGKPGVVVRFGSGSVVVEGNTGYGAPPFRIEGGCVSGGGNTWYPSGLSATAATTGALADAYTYANGTAGVGATLTRVGSGAFPTLDGVAMVAGYRVLIKNETAGNAPYNGLYTITQLGDGSNPWILTRVLDADTAGEITNAIAYVSLGTVNTGLAFQCGSVATIGTDAATWSAYNQIGVDISTTTADCAIDLGPDSVFAQVGTSFVGNSYKVNPDGGSYKTGGRIAYLPAFDQSTLGPTTGKSTVVLQNRKFQSAYGAAATGGSDLPKGNTGAGSATLCAVTTIPGGAIDKTGKGVRFRLWGTTSADAHLKQVQVYVGGTTLVLDTGAVAANNKPWEFTGEIVRTTDSSHQSAMVWGNFNGAAVAPAITLMTTHDLASDNTITVFLTGDTATDDVVLHAFSVEVIQ